MKYTREYLKELDEKIKYISLTYDYAFKSVMMKNRELFKKFLIRTLYLDLTLEESNLIFLDKELVKENYKEKGKTVDLNVRIGPNLIITIEINRSNFEKLKLRNLLYLEKLHTMQFEVGDNYNELKSRYIYQLNLNTKMNNKDVSESIIVNYDILSKNIYNENLKIYIKNLVCYKEKVYNNIEMMRFDEIFMAGILANSFTELYDIMKYILSEKELDHFMGSVVNMSKKYFRIHDWAKEEMEKLVEEEGKRIDREEKERKEKEEKERKLKVEQEDKERKTRLDKEEKERKARLDKEENERKAKLDKEEKERKAKLEKERIKLEEEKKQFEQEKEQNIVNTIINMLENNIDKDVISKITGMKVDEINKIEETMKK